MPERASTPAEPIRIELTADERELLRHGLGQWGGPAELSDPMAVAMGVACPCCALAGRTGVVSGCRR